MNPAGRLHLRLNDETSVAQLDGWDPEALGEDADEMLAFLMRKLLGFCRACSPPSNHRFDPPAHNDRGKAFPA